MYVISHCEFLQSLFLFDYIIDLLISAIPVTICFALLRSPSPIRRSERDVLREREEEAEDKERKEQERKVRKKELQYQVSKFDHYQAYNVFFLLLFELITTTTT